MLARHAAPSSSRSSAWARFHDLSTATVTASSATGEEDGSARQHAGQAGYRVDNAKVTIEGVHVRMGAERLDARIRVVRRTQREMIATLRAGQR